MTTCSRKKQGKTRRPCTVALSLDRGERTLSILSVAPVLVPLWSQRVHVGGKGMYDHIRPRGADGSWMRRTTPSFIVEGGWVGRKLAPVSSNQTFYFCIMWVFVFYCVAGHWLLVGWMGREDLPADWLVSGGVGGRRRGTPWCALWQGRCGGCLCVGG